MLKDTMRTIVTAPLMVPAYAVACALGLAVGLASVAVPVAAVVYLARWWFQ